MTGIRRAELVLAGVLVAESVIFSLIAPNFATSANAAEIVRLGVEVGLLAIALTPIVITGGIDLSCGALLGLSAVVFGALWRDAGWTLWAAAIGAMAIGASGGALNGWLISRWSLPPLMVTLGSLSLFRGLAEGLTGGIENYTGLPPRFLALGQGFLSAVPAQAPWLLAAALAYWVVVHRTIRGRAYFAIGHNQAASRHAGLAVGRRLFELYVASGALAGLAAIIYVAHLGQAKADAGTGYELTAVTAVVLGGTAISGGSGTIVGTVIGLTAMVVLQNGLRLAALPAELAGVLTGVLLVGAIGAPRVAALLASRRAVMTPVEQDFSPVPVRVSPVPVEEEMRNSQLAVLCGVIVASACLVAGTNWWLVRSLQRGHTGPAMVASSSGVPSSTAPVVVGMMPKAKGDPYFVSCRQGADEAAKESAVDLIWDGPTELDPAKQNEVVEAWITRGVNVVAVSVENQAAISTVLRKARQRGIKVLTWDADSEPDARDFLINQATPQGIGETLTDEAARLTGGSGDFAIVTASLSAANQNQWIGFIKARLAAKYPKLHLVTIRPSDGDRDRAFAETQTILKVYPSVKLVMGIAAPAVPGAAEAVRQSGRKDVAVTGLSLPNMCKPYVHDGIIKSVVLWNTRDLGYLTVRAAAALARGELKPGQSAFDGGRLGSVTVTGDQVLLGKPFIFTKDNIDRFDF